MSENSICSRSDKTADRSSGKSIGWSGSGCMNDGSPELWHPCRRLQDFALYLAAMVCAITGGATAFSHVNDSGFLAGKLLAGN